MWTKISEYAQSLWENMEYNMHEREILVAQMLNFKAKQGTYKTPFIKTFVTPRTWWMSCEDQPPYLKDLALKMFAITPHSASCERMFSVLGWLYGKRRTNLDVDTIESMAKIRHFYQNNIRLKLTFLKEQTDEEFHNLVDLVDKSVFFEDEDNNNDNENNDEDGYEEVIESQIPNHEVYVLIEDNVDLTNSIFLENNNEINEEEEEDL